VVSVSNRERRLASQGSPFDPAAAAGLRANDETHVTVITAMSSKCPDPDPDRQSGNSAIREPMDLRRSVFPTAGSPDCLIATPGVLGVA